jgi:hypothetical protein
MTALKQLVDKIMMIQSNNVADVTSDADKVRESVLSCVQFGVKCLVRILADKKMRNADVQNVVVDNLSLWIKVSHKQIKKRNMSENNIFSFYFYY